MSDHCPRPECRFTPDRPRHVHVADDLRQIGEVCRYCKQNLWIILFGGLLPARVQCQACGAGFNLTQRLREAAQDVPVARSNR